MLLAITSKLKTPGASTEYSDFRKEGALQLILDEHGITLTLLINYIEFDRDESSDRNPVFKDIIGGGLGKLEIILSFTKLGIENFTNLFYFMLWRLYV